MDTAKTSTLSNALIWFGAAISLAEILTGTFFAPLGFLKGLAAIVLGHLIGCALLFFAGLIGAKEEKGAMETVRLSFGRKGSVLFSALNVLQLVGWTAIMIDSGAAAAQYALPLGGKWVWALAIGALIALWVAVGIGNLDKVNILAMGALFVLTLVLSAVVFSGGVLEEASQGNMTFGAAVELSAAMPLSWLPLISDYTRFARKKKQATAASAAVYFLASCWMYAIGLGAALFAGESDIAAIMVSAGLGVGALLVIILSTVTTTFLDVYSAGVSAAGIAPRCREKWAALAVCAVGTLLALFAPVSRFEAFLYLIGSVFAPLIAILIADYFILKKDASAKAFDAANLILWAFGFGLYRLSLRLDTPVGNTLPVMAIVAALAILVHRLRFGSGIFAPERRS